jgi:hypothetical protein
MEQTNPFYGPWPPVVKYFIDNIFYLESEGVHSLFKPNVYHLEKQAMFRRWYRIQEDMKEQGYVEWKD